MPPDQPPDLPTSPGQLSPEARDALILAAVQWLVQREEARSADRGYLRALAEAPISLPPRLDQVAVLVVIAAAAAAAGVSGPELWALVTGGAAVAGP